MLSLYLDGIHIRNHLSQRATVSITKRFAPKVNKSRLPMPVKVYRWLSQSGLYKTKFKQAWLLMDRDTQADDNAEHLYRWIKENKPEINAWFVLRRTSHDWKRLESEGFRLIDFDSLDHKMALLNAQNLISSHIDNYVVRHLKPRYYRDLMRWDVTYLRHGVSQSDMSEWLNGKPITNLLTSSISEYLSIISNENGYKYTKRETSLTGLPRHDRLISNKHSKEKLILIMPTWRRSLEIKSDSIGSMREHNPDFGASEFFHIWKNLLTSNRLKEISKKQGYKVVLFPHANMSENINDFINAGINTLSHNDVVSLQNLILEASLIITDYSSVAFEMAYIERPVLYYQFDEDYVFGGGHTTQKGYFDYRRDGFGPVCIDQDTLLTELEKILEANCQPAEPYAGRMKNFFAYRDGKCCERVFNLIAGKVDTLDMVPQLLDKSDKRAAQLGCWPGI